MTKKNLYSSALGLLTIGFMTLCSCGSDRWAEYYPYTGCNLWIDSIMREDYLWWQEMPAFNDLNYFLSAEEFLNAVRSPNDNNYSRVDTLYATPAPTYGFDYSLSRIPENDTAYCALITYVIPHSPAAEAGLQRGEWIMLVDGDYITLKRESVLSNGGNRELLIGTYHLRPGTGESGEESIAEIVANRNVTLPAATPIADPIIPTYTLFDQHIAYVVYNSFSTERIDEVLQFSQYCHSNRIDNLILDLRYNEGGEIECAQLWGALLAPASQLGNTFASLYYNDKHSERNHELTLDPTLFEGRGTNLNLSCLYVLTSNLTSGAAEMLINCLKPYMEVILIGGNTKGDYYGTASYSDGRFPWILRPVVCEVFNAEGTADYANGFTPNYPIGDLDNLSQVLPLGNPNEALLSVALGYIHGDIPLPESNKTKNNLIRNVKVKRYFTKGLSIHQIYK